MSMIGGSASITSYNAPAQWTCAPTAPVTAPAPLTCSADAGQITAPSTISLTMSVAPGTRGLKNCAVAAINGEPLDQSCVDIDIPPPPVVDIDKQCKPAVWDAATQRFKANCVITVSTTPSYHNGYLTFTERMTASGAAATLASLTQSGWTCTPPAVPPALNTPVLVACSRPAAGFTSSTIGLVVTFPNATTGIKNCANLYWSAQPLTPGQTLQQQPVDKSCTKIVKDFGKADIEKKCTEATLLPAPNPTGRYGSACTITVTTSGPVQTPLSFTENLTGNGVTTFTSSSPAGWACVPSPVINGTTMNCSIGNSLVSPVFKQLDHRL